MRTRRTIRHTAPTATRWTSWASQLTARYGRWMGGARMRLALHVRQCRVPLLLFHRWLAFQTQVYPQIKISIAEREAGNRAASHVYAPQMLFLQSFVNLFQRTLKSETERRAPTAAGTPARGFEFRRATPTHFTRESLWRLAMTVAIEPTKTEHISSTLDQHFSIRRDALFTEVSKRLTQRVRRVDELAVVRSAMTLRKETPVVMTRPMSSETAEEQSSFERQHRQPAFSAREMPEVNVEQLAQQVLKQIDRRVIARRERLGQI